jgi:hypothetical protein
MENYTREQQRFLLVRTAFKQALANQANPELNKGTFTASKVAVDIVESADAVLAAMDQTPDTGAPADEQPTLKSIRDRVQDLRDTHLRTCEKIPTKDDCVRYWRGGVFDAYANALAIIDAAMEKAGEAEDDDATG